MSTMPLEMTLTVRSPTLRKTVSTPARSISSALARVSTSSGSAITSPVRLLMIGSATTWPVMREAMPSFLLYL